MSNNARPGASTDITAGARRTELRGECLKALSSESEDGDGEPRVRKEASPLRVSTNRSTQSLISLLMSELVLRQTDCRYYMDTFKCSY